MSGIGFPRVGIAQRIIIEWRVREYQVELFAGELLVTGWGTLEVRCVLVTGRDTLEVGELLKTGVDGLQMSRPGRCGEIVCGIKNGWSVYVDGADVPVCFRGASHSS